MKMNQAQKEMERLVIQFATAKHGEVDGGVDRYAEQFEREMEKIVRKYAAKKEVLKVYGNGLQKVQILDKNGEIVCDFVEAAHD